MRDHGRAELPGGGDDPAGGDDRLRRWSRTVPSEACCALTCHGSEWPGWGRRTPGGRRFIEEMFTATDTSNFAGLVHCTAEGEFTGVAVELDADNRIFTTLPVIPVQR